MNKALKWKLITGFLLVFTAGGVTGAFLAAATTRHFLFFAPHHGIAAEKMRERLRVELKLTPEQTAKISPILDKASAQLEQIRMDTARRVHETFAEAHREMGPNLNEQQRAKLYEMRQRHQRRLHRMRGHESPPADLPP
jgi:Spy/CpxP family protein refolding chaperone